MRKKEKRFYISPKEKNKLIIGFLLCCLGISLIAFGFSTMTSCGNKKIDEEVTTENFFTARKEPYYNYLYSEHCPCCKELAETTLKDYKNNDLYKINLDVVGKDYNSFDFENKESCDSIESTFEEGFCTVNLEKYENKMIGISNLNNFYIVAVPTLIKIEDQKISNVYVGIDEINEVLK